MQAEDNVTDDVKEVRTLCLDNIPRDQPEIGDWVLVVFNQTLVVKGSLFESSWNYDSGVWWCSLL